MILNSWNSIQPHFPTFLIVFSACFDGPVDPPGVPCRSVPSANLLMLVFPKSESSTRGMIPRFIPPWKVRFFKFVFYLAMICVLDGVSGERCPFHILPTCNISATFWGLTEPLLGRKKHKLAIKNQFQEGGSQKPFARRTSFCVNNLNISSVFCPCEDFPQVSNSGVGKSLVSRPLWLWDTPKSLSVGTVVITIYHLWHDHLSSPIHSSKKTLLAQQTLE